MIFKPKSLTVALGAIIMLLGPMAPARSAYAQTRAVSAGHEAVDFSLLDLNGRVTRLSQYRGHPIVVDFWATWCGPCRRQIPELEKLYSQYHQTRGLVVLGVACDSVKGEGVSAIRPFVKEYRIGYPVLLAEEPVLDQFDIDAIPTTIFLGPDGKVVGRLLGAGDPRQLIASVKSLLAGQGNPGPQKKLTPEEERKQNLYSIEYRVSKARLSHSFFLQLRLEW